MICNPIIINYQSYLHSIKVLNSYRLLTIPYPSLTLQDPQSCRVCVIFLSDDEDQWSRKNYGSRCIKDHLLVTSCVEKRQARNIQWSFHWACPPKRRPERWRRLSSTSWLMRVLNSPDHWDWAWIDQDEADSDSEEDTLISRTRAGMRRRKSKWSIWRWSGRRVWTT